MLTTPTPLVQLRDGLSAAEAASRRAGRRAAWGRAGGRAAAVLGLAAGAAAIEIAVTRSAGGAASHVVLWTTAVGLVVAGVTAGVSAARRRSTPLRDVAERLDLAAGTGNAIATALDLCDEPTPTPMTRRAILDGVEAVRRSGGVRPVIRAAPAASRAGPVGLVVAAAAVGLSLLLPVPKRTVSGEPVDGTQSAGRSGAAGTIDRMPAVLPAQDAEREGNRPPSTTNSGPAADTAVQADASPARPPASATVSGGAGGRAAAGPSAAASPVRPPTPADASPGAHRDPPVASNGSGATGALASSGDGLSSPNTPGVGGRGKARSATSLAAKDATAGGPPGAAGEADTTDARDEPDQPPAGGGGLAKVTPTVTVQQQADPGDQASGQKPTGELNAPKKSRGVAPMMLANRQPDLLRGRPLPGPDRRTVSPVPPQPAPEQPFPPAKTNDRQGSESAVSVYQVPAGAASAVRQYLERLHQNAAADPARPQ